VVRGVELGATDYLTKPFNPVLLKARRNLLPPLDLPVRAAVAGALDMMAATRTTRAAWALPPIRRAPAGDRRVDQSLQFGDGCHEGITHRLDLFEAVPLRNLLEAIVGKRQFQFDVWGDTVNTRHGSRKTVSWAASTSAAACGCICAIGRRAGRWDLLTSKVRKRSRIRVRRGCENDGPRALGREGPWLPR
jgi:hypothetical protein